MKESNEHETVRPKQPSEDINKREEEIGESEIGSHVTLSKSEVLSQNKARMSEEDTGKEKELEEEMRRIKEELEIEEKNLEESQNRF